MPLELSKLQKEILFGILLGDAHLKVNKKKTKASLVVLQSIRHKDYVFHLYEVFKNLQSFSKGATFYRFTDKRFPGKTYERWSF